MLVPIHKIGALLKQRLDLTPEEALPVSHALGMAWASLEVEDFFYVGQRLAFGGLSAAAGGAGNFNELGVWNKQADPSIVIVSRVSTLNPMSVQLVLPNLIAGFAKFIFSLRDSSFYNPAVPATITAPASEGLSRAVAINTTAAVGPITAGETELDFVLREGWGLICRGLTANIADAVSFATREVDLRVR